MKRIYNFTSLILLLTAITSCGGNEITIPKPPTYLRQDFPEHKYMKYQSNCNYSFDISSAYEVKDVLDKNEKTCHKDINLGPLNGMIHFSYIQMTEPLSKYVNFANDKVEEHKIKATGIEDFHILHPEKRVFGTFFELKGDVASPFQFYLTDSTDRFVSGVVYFNSVPNYDSLKPSLEYVKTDLLKLVNSFQWEK
jgi:gliding motility-associated lipoprotein GldD